MAATKGNCYLCGKELGKTAMKNHILKVHCPEQGQECRLLKIEGSEDKNYWLYVDIPLSSTLKTLDGFLRKIWLECCGHMSAFSNGCGEVGMSVRIGNFNDGDVLLHEYDFGSTTETLITFIGTVYRSQQRGVRLLARNAPIKFICRECASPAVLIDVQDYENKDPFYCRKCAEKNTDPDTVFLPVTNSPRMGVCGYCGESDTFTYAPRTPKYMWVKK